MRGVFRVLVLVVTSWSTSLSTRGIAQSSPLSTSAEQYLLKSLNAERAAAGLKPLVINKELQAASRAHVVAIMQARTLSHRLKDEADVTGRGFVAGAHFSRITENLAVGPTIIAMHVALMQSPHHRANILDDQVNSVGIAVVQNEGMLWAVEDFSRSVEKLSFDEQEQRVSLTLRELRLQAAPSSDARASCSLASGYVGERPMFLVRYTTGDLASLPEQVRIRVQSTGIRTATVGACGPTKEKNGFVAYNIAVEFFR